FFITYLVINNADLNHYCPQSSPTVSAGFSSTLSFPLLEISKSPPQSGQVTISPTTASSGTLMSAPHSWHSTFDINPFYSPHFFFLLICPWQSQLNLQLSIASPKALRNL